MKKNVIILVSGLLVVLLAVLMVILFTGKKEFDVVLKVGTEGGSISSERGLATSAIKKGDDLKVYISPNEGYEVEKVLVNDKEIDLKTLVYEKDNPNASSEDGVAIYTISKINKDYTIEAYFKTK